MHPTSRTSNTSVRTAFNKRQVRISRGAPKEGPAYAPRHLCFDFFNPRGETSRGLQRELDIR
jgi:hypothetical protein